MKTFTLLFAAISILAWGPVFAQDKPASNLPEGFDVEGHRGARGLKPENTLPAFETALDLGVTTLELDLHFTQDGVVVIWHDDDIPAEKCRLDANSPVDAPDPDETRPRDPSLMISALTFEQIGAYRCDRNPDPAAFPDQENLPTALAGDAYGITSLEALIVFVQDYALSDEKTDAQRQNAAAVQFNIETKRKPTDPSAINDDFDGEHAGAFELAILDLVEGHDLESRVILQSFDHRSLWAARQENDTIRLAALTSRLIPEFDELAEQGATIWSCNYFDLTPDRLQEAHAAGLLVIPWTVNDAETMRQLIDIGVDGIITDRPDILLSLGSQE